MKKISHSYLINHIEVKHIHWITKYFVVISSFSLESNFYLQKELGYLFKQITVTSELTSNKEQFLAVVDRFKYLFQLHTKPFYENEISPLVPQDAFNIIPVSSMSSASNAACNCSSRARVTIIENYQVNVNVTNMHSSVLVFCKDDELPTHSFAFDPQDSDYDN
ncbi:hypothetical protein P9112_010525 [Eukaryota sp. TZLM1-RC]